MSANTTDIAVIAISCKFPEANNKDEFWNNLLNNRESIHQFTNEELIAAGVDKEQLNNPNYIKAKGILNNIEDFAANFFGYNAHDAKLMDPQQRVFLESAWEALESAGYIAEKFKGTIGVYASMADSLYLQNNLLKNSELVESFDWFQARIATSGGALSTKASYKLNLTGPSINIATACSSSLVAIATACTALIDYECDLAIAGAVHIAVPQQVGYIYQAEGIESADGHCRPFSAESSGTVFSNGAGILVLKRLADALQDRDDIAAVIKGWSVNNDGADKAGFSAPSVNGQASCVASAFSFADINPESLSYIEAHGTGTALGDPIEIEALAKAFNISTNKKQFCAIGSVKSNIGHLDVASGMASIIKVILALKNKIIPATLHYKNPNPAIDFVNTPFFVNAKLTDWDSGTFPRRAGVNASGIGGTNAFILLEEATPVKEETLSRKNQLLVFSAKSKTALDAMTRNLKQHLASVKTASDFADVAYTLQNGRAEFAYRRFLVCESLHAINILQDMQDSRVYSNHYNNNISRKIVFMFPDQDAYYADIASNLYSMEPGFAKIVDEYSAGRNLDTRQSMFVIGYSLAKFLISFGVQPDTMFGYGLGEYVASCLLGKVSLEDGLKLVASGNQLKSENVKLADNIQTCLDEGYNTFIEIGPSTVLSKLVIEDVGENPQILVQNILPNQSDTMDDQAALLHLLGQLWLYGIKIDWTAFSQHEVRYRVVLPTYPFERQRYWVDADTNSLNSVQQPCKQLPYCKWFYEPSWVRSSFASDLTFNESVIAANCCWILLMDNQGLAEGIAGILLNLGQQVFKVYIHNHSNLAPNEYTINLKDKESYITLIQDVLNKTQLPLCIINLLALTDEHVIESYDPVTIEQTVDLSFYSNLFLFQALVATGNGSKVNCLIVGNEIFSITGTENIYPAKASITGPCRVIPQEHATFKLRMLDILLSDIQDHINRKKICRQIIFDALIKGDVNTENVIAYRGNYRWIQSFKPLSLSIKSKLQLADNGVYLFTGGLGGIALTLAKEIATASKNAQLILLARSEFPYQVEWDAWLASHGTSNATSKKIVMLKAIIGLGARIVILKTDITDYAQVASMLTDIRRDFKAINGVIHTAGIPGGGLMQLKTEAIVDTVLAPKVAGTYLLTSLLQNELLDFFLLCSSVSSIVGEVSQIDYCSANAVLDAFINAKILKKTQLFSVVNWNTWREVGMAVDTERPRDVNYFDRNNDISPKEGGLIFIDIINNNCKQAIISNVDIGALIDSTNQDKSQKFASNLIERADFLEMAQEYVPPNNITEIALTQIWQDILGINNIGILDVFEDLGGHSLNALHLLTKVEDKFRVKISLQSFTESNTIQKMAAKIDGGGSSMHPSSAAVVTIRSMGKEQPLFCLHPVGGNTFCYLPLAKYLKYDCPIYGLQDPSLQAGKIMFASLEEMATYYVAAIRQIQAHGPYMLCGLSFGATLSIEVARQLRQEGAQVKPLVLFDGWAQFSDMQSQEMLFKEVAMQRANKNIQASFADMSWERMKLLLKYEVPIILDKLILFKAKTLLPEYKYINHPNNYWEKYTSNPIAVHIISGDHETILEEPNIVYLAKKMDEILCELSIENCLT